MANKLTAVLDSRLEDFSAYSAMLAGSFFHVDSQTNEVCLLGFKGQTLECMVFRDAALDTVCAFQLPSSFFFVDKVPFSAFDERADAVVGVTPSLEVILFALPTQRAAETVTVLHTFTVESGDFPVNETVRCVLLSVDTLVLSLFNHHLTLVDLSNKKHESFETAFKETELLFANGSCLGALYFGPNFGKPAHEKKLVVETVSFTDGKYNKQQEFVLAIDSTAPFVFHWEAGTLFVGTGCDLYQVRPTPDVLSFSKKNTRLSALPVVHLKESRSVYEALSPETPESGTKVVVVSYVLAQMLSLHSGLFLGTDTSHRLIVFCLAGGVFVLEQLFAHTDLLLLSCLFESGSVSALFVLQGYVGNDRVMLLRVPATVFSKQIPTESVAPFAYQEVWAFHNINSPTAVSIVEERARNEQVSMSFFEKQARGRLETKEIRPSLFQDSTVHLLNETFRNSLTQQLLVEVFREAELPVPDTVITAVKRLAKERKTLARSKAVKTVVAVPQFFLLVFPNTQPGTWKNFLATESEATFFGAPVLLSVSDRFDDVYHISDSHFLFIAENSAVLFETTENRTVDRVAHEEAVTTVSTFELLSKSLVYVLQLVETVQLVVNAFSKQNPQAGFIVQDQLPTENLVGKAEQVRVSNKFIFVKTDCGLFVANVLETLSVSKVASFKQLPLQERVHRFAVSFFASALTVTVLPAHFRKVFAKKLLILKIAVGTLERFLDGKTEFVVKTTKFDVKGAEQGRTELVTFPTPIKRPGFVVLQLLQTGPCVHAVLACEEEPGFWIKRLFFSPNEKDITNFSVCEDKLVLQTPTKVLTAKFVPTPLVTTNQKTLCRTVSNNEHYCTHFGKPFVCTDANLVELLPENSVVTGMDCSLAFRDTELVHFFCVTSTRKLSADVQNAAETKLALFVWNYYKKAVLLAETQFEGFSSGVLFTNNNQLAVMSEGALLFFAVGVVGKSQEFMELKEAVPTFSLKKRDRGQIDVLATTPNYSIDKASVQGLVGNFDLSLIRKTFGGLFYLNASIYRRFLLLLDYDGTATLFELFSESKKAQKEQFLNWKRKMKTKCHIKETGFFNGRAVVCVDKTGDLFVVDFARNNQIILSIIDESVSLAVKKEENILVTVSKTGVVSYFSIKQEM